MRHCVAQLQMLVIKKDQTHQSVNIAPYFRLNESHFNSWVWKLSCCLGWKDRISKSLAGVGAQP